VIVAASTNNETPTVLGWGFFLPDRAGSRVLFGVPAEACGLRRLPDLAVPGHISLSPGHSSLRPRSLKLVGYTWMADGKDRLSGHRPDNYNEGIQDQSGGAP